MHELNNQQTRQLIDCEQIYASYRAAVTELATRFAGSVSWKQVSGRRYLYRKRRNQWVSLGPESEDTHATYRQFMDGRAALRIRRDTLNQRLQDMAPVNRALKLGRVPITSARLLRRMDRAGLLGHGIKVAGTHALYAYERMGGVQFGEEAVTTMDIDLLYDSRVKLKLVSGELSRDGIMGMLKQQDATFRLTERNSFRAVNNDGFMVDLIMRPAKAASSTRSRVGDDAEDLSAVEIEGLQWLENAPAISQIVMDERGFPLTVTVPDPRVFLCHKAWIARRDDRDPLKKRRDMHQARSIAEMLAIRIPSLTFDDPALSALPTHIMALGQVLMQECAATQRENQDRDWDR